MLREKSFSALPKWAIRTSVRADIRIDLKMGNLQHQEFPDTVDIINNVEAGVLKKRGRLGSPFETRNEQGEQKGARASFDKKTGQRSGYQGIQGQNVKPRGRFKEKQRALGDQIGRGLSPKLKPKSRGKDYRGKDGNFWTAASGDDPNTRRSQGTRGRPSKSNKSRRGQRGDQSVGTGGETKEQSRFEQNQLLVCGLSTLTTVDGLVNFIEVMSGGTVKDVMRTNDKALITMANDIASKSY